MGCGVKKVTVLFLFLLACINFSDKAIIGYSAIPIMRQFHLTKIEWGMVGSSFYWLFSISGFLLAWSSDYFGAKRVLSVLAGIWSIAQWMVAATVSFPLLVTARVLLGLGEGPYYATAVNLLSKWYQPKDRTFIFSIINFGSTVGPALLAPLLVGVIITFGWRPAFSILGVSSVLWLIFWMIFAREKPQQFMNISEMPAKPRVRTKLSEMIPIMLSPSYILTMFVGFSAYWALAFLIVWIPPYLVEVRHFSQGQMGYISIIPWISGGVLQLVFGALSDKLFRKSGNSRKTRVGVLAPCLILSAILIYLATIIPSVTWVIICLSIGPGLSSVSFVVLATVISDIVPEEHRGMAQGLQVAFATLAGLIGPSITGVIVQAAGNNVLLGFNHAFLLEAGITFIFGILFWLFVHPDRVRQKISATPVHTSSII